MPDEQQDPQIDTDEPEVTRAGLFHEVVGKAKEALGELASNEELADAGREEQAEAERDPDEPPAAR